MHPQDDCRCDTCVAVCLLPAPCPAVLFRPLHKEVMQDRVSFICGKEGVQLDADAFDLLAQVWDRDRTGGEW